MYYSFADIDQENLDALQALERDIGKSLVALHEVKLKPAQLARGDINRLRELEERMGVVLLAVGDRN
tara:strand:+ start:1417 stop:1617 length:201 start_codon:yes stop_codon:yes gene_type:complete